MRNNVIFNQLVDVRRDLRLIVGLSNAERKRLLDRETKLVEHLAELNGITRKRAADLADLQIRLEEFKHAAAQLNRTWAIVEGFTGTEITGLPEHMPSFDEFALEIADAEVQA